MDQSLVNEFSQIGFKLQKIKLYSLVPQLHVREAYTLLKINNSLEPKNQNCIYEELQEQLAVTKSAISQMVSSLEEKGYIMRQIDPNDRRKFVLSVTTQGQELAEQLHGKMEYAIKETISRFGEDNAREFIKLFNQFADTLASVKEEMQKSL